MLIAMAVWDTEENGRTWMTGTTLGSLTKTVDFTKHRLIISDNGSCQATRDLYPVFSDIIEDVIYNGENIGTARAINKAWERRLPGEHAVKMDNDVVIHQAEWADWIEDAFSRDGTLGILGLKRNDLAENPWTEDNFKSELRMLPHERGQRWIVVEEVRHVMGTCQAYSSALLDRIGFLAQPGVYGFDDSQSSIRAKVAGFKRAFLVGFEIDHIDPGGSAFSQWKIDRANEDWPICQWMMMQYETGLQDVRCEA